MKLFVFCFFLFTAQFSFGQNYEAYDSLVAIARNFYNEGDYEKASENFEAAFTQLNGKAYQDDRYTAGCSYALSGNSDSAFYHLYYLAEHPRVRYRDFEHISSDADLQSLHEKKRWDELLKIVKANKDEFEKDFDWELIAILDEVYESDQNSRYEIDSIELQFGRESTEMQDHWNKMHITDSINVIKVTKILDERGWLGANIVGQQGNSTLFLVIQHADIETQLKYIPMMREAVKEGNARASSLALLEDRVALRQGQRQIYGSQIGRDEETGEYYVLPLIEPEKVNERRAEVDLPPIEDYVSIWGLTWDLEKHLNNIEKYEKKKK